MSNDCKPVEAPPLGSSDAHESAGMRRRRQAAERTEAILGPCPLVVGLDLASTAHVAWVRMRTNAAIDSFGAPHSLAGVRALREHLDELRAAHGCDRIVVGMEPTAHYWKNVVAALEAPPALVCLLVNSVSVFHDRAAKHLRRAKGDRRDAEIIAGLVARGDFLRTSLECDPRAIRMRILADEHEDLLDLAGAERRRIRCGLELVLPEHLDVFEDPLGTTSCAVLRRLGLPESEAPASLDTVLARLDPSSVRSRSGRRVYPSKIKALVERLRARPSFGVESHRAPMLARVARSVSRYEALEDERADVASHLVALYEELPFAPFLSTIPAVSPLNHALVLAFVGDPRRFDRASCLVSRAGLEPQENFSGLGSGPTRISRAGQGRLRSILYRIAMGRHLQDSRTREIYERLRGRDDKALTHRQALVVIAGKYLRLVYRLCVAGEPFDPRRCDGRGGPRTARKVRRRAPPPAPAAGAS